MPKFKCSNCYYITNNKRDFDNHLNRKILCNKNNIHGLTKLDKQTFCNVCDKDFASNQSLKRHNNMYHNKINGNKNKIINGNNNNLIETQNNINTQNNISNPIIIQQIIHPYEYNDINDLTLFEQYLSLTSKDSPYTALLDHLNLNPNKPEYNNIYIGNLNKNYMDIHNGQKWLKEIMVNALSNMVDTKRILIGSIFNRFRFFLSNKATKLIPNAYYYGFRQNYYFHKKIVRHIKMHLHNNRKMENIVDENIPSDKNDEIFWALSKKFDWPEVNKLIIKMDNLKIDLDKNLEEIKDQIINIIKRPKLKNFFKKFLIRLDYLITNFKNNGNSDSSSSETDISGNNESESKPNNN